MNGWKSVVTLEIAGSNSIFSEWSNSKYGSSLRVPTNSKMGGDLNFSLVLNLLKTGKGTSVNGDKYEGYEISIYENGNLINSSYLNIEQWNLFKKNCKDSTDSFFLGNLRVGQEGKGLLNEYGKMTLKNCRFYTRPLNDAEIKLNYDTRLAYDEDNN